MVGKSQVSRTQLETLVTFIEQNEDIGRNRVPYQGDFIREVSDKKWEMLGKLLNGLGGIKKSPNKWRVFWNEKKYIVRRKVSRIRSGAMIGTNMRPLDPIEKRIIKIVGETPKGDESYYDENDCEEKEYEEADFQEEDYDDYKEEIVHIEGADWQVESVSQEGSQEDSQATEGGQEDIYWVVDDHTYSEKSKFCDSPITEVVIDHGSPHSAENNKFSTTQTADVKELRTWKRRKPIESQPVPCEPPDWFRKLEERRIAVDERNAASFELLVKEVATIREILEKKANKLEK